MERATKRRGRRSRALRLLRALEPRRALFVLPNLFTLSSVFCGFFAIVIASGEGSSRRLALAALAVFFAVFFDMADGRVARLTRTQSDFGVQLDSLADVIAFGVAPAAIVYAWSLRALGALGLLVAVCYVSCGAMRLARFNVLAARIQGASHHFVGLPIPVAAGTMTSVMMVFQHGSPAPMQSATPVVVLALILSFLMISNVRYRTFKDVHLGGKTFALAASILLGLAVLAALVRPALALLTLFSAYVLVGPIEEIIFFRRRRRERVVAVPPGPPAETSPTREDDP
jgi:CDP-diacylglycerol--serine O-phosphatidyltransferase